MIIQTLEMGDSECSITPINEVEIGFGFHSTSDCKDTNYWKNFIGWAKRTIYLSWYKGSLERASVITI